MKGIITLLFLATTFLVVSCQKERSFTTSDFSKAVFDTLKPNKDLGKYAAAKLEIKGKVDDTIRIKFYGIDQKYFGDFDDSLILDFYGGVNVEFMFDPYLATEGFIEVKYGIY